MTRSTRQRGLRELARLLPAAAPGGRGAPPRAPRPAELGGPARGRSAPDPGPARRRGLDRHLPALTSSAARAPTTGVAPASRSGTFPRVSATNCAPARVRTPTARAAAPSISSSARQGARLQLGLSARGTPRGRADSNNRSPGLEVGEPRRPRRAASSARPPREGQAAALIREQPHGTIWPAVLALNTRVPLTAPAGQRVALPARAAAAPSRAADGGACLQPAASARRQATAESRAKSSRMCGHGCLYCDDPRPCPRRPQQDSPFDARFARAAPQATGAGGAVRPVKLGRLTLPTATSWRRSGRVRTGLPPAVPGDGASNRAHRMISSHGLVHGGRPDAQLTWSVRRTSGRSRHPGLRPRRGGAREGARVAVEK